MALLGNVRGLSRGARYPAVCLDLATRGPSQLIEDDEVWSRGQWVKEDWFRRQPLLVQKR